MYKYHMNVTFVDLSFIKFIRVSAFKNQLNKNMKMVLLRNFDQD